MVDLSGVTAALTVERVYFNVLALIHYRFRSNSSVVYSEQSTDNKLVIWLERLKNH